MWFMIESRRTRRRPTEVTREAHRRSFAVALELGRTIRTRRRQLGLSQRALAALVDVDQTRVSQVERGLGASLPLERWVAIGVALGRPLAAFFSRPLGEPRDPADAGHLAMQERLLELARLTGRAGLVELPTRPANPRHSIDVCVRDSRHSVLLIQEAWNTFGDVGAAIRSTNRKLAEAADLAAIVDDSPPYRVAAVWVVRPTATNHALVGRYPEIFGSAFSGSSRAWAKALQTGSAPPNEPGLVWLDPIAGRITEWRLRR